MTNINKNERFIPLKNYVLAAVIVVVIIGLTFYGFAWYNVLRENKVSTSYLVKEKVISQEIIDLQEIPGAFSEAPNTYFIYVSYTGDEEVYDLEKNLKPLINEYSLNDSFYYLNVTSLKTNNEDYIEEVNDALNLKDKKIEKVPTIIYFKDGKVSDIITRRDDYMMNIGDFQKLLETNNIVKE